MEKTIKRVCDLYNSGIGGSRNISIVNYCAQLGHAVSGCYGNCSWMAASYDVRLEWRI